jgi:methyl-accepting chemotaxis protein
VSFFLVLTGVVCSSFIAIYFFVRAMNREMNHTLEIASEGILQEFYSVPQKMRLLEEIIGTKKDIAYFIQYKDVNSLNRELGGYLKISGLDTITVTDGAGTVISRPHAPDRVGDSVAAKGYIAPVLKGKSVTVLEPGTTIKLGLFYGFPVMIGNKTIGAIAIGVNLANPAVLDRLKSMYQADATLFFGEKRLSTTVMQNGERIESDAASEIVDKVVGEGKVVHSVLDLGEVPYQSVYKPLIFEGKNIGIAAAGISLIPFRRTIGTVVLFVLLTGLAIMLLALAVTLFFARSISGPMKRLAALVKKVKDGNLVVPEDKFQYGRRDEIGDIFDALRENLQAQLASMIEFKNSTTEIAGDADSLSGSSDELHKMAENLKFSAADIAQITNKTHVSTRRASDYMKEVSEKSDNVLKMASGGAQVLSDVLAQTNVSVKRLGETLRGMEDVMRTVGDNHEHIKSLGGSIQEITGFVSVIGGIADQTNLLALNAAIEAARAGESGRGFAVVAEEVRKLAEESARAAKRIGGVIEPIQEKTRTIMDGTSQSVSDLRGATEKMSSARDEFTSSRDNIRQVDEMMRQIVSLTQDQTDSSHRVSDTIEELTGEMARLSGSMGEIDANAASTLRSALIVSETAKAMRGLAETLENVLSHFRVDEMEEMDEASGGGSPEGQ